MKIPIWNVTRNLAMAMILAVVMVFLLLWGIHHHALPDVIAQSPSSQQIQPSTASVSPAWVTNQVFTQRYTSTENIVWTIPSCNVVITLPKNLIGSDATHVSVIFTFTTEPKQSFPAPLQSIDYFFSLDGSTPQVLPSSREQTAIKPQGPPSFNEGMSPTIEWSYQGADLGTIHESTLRLYREWGLFGDQPWKVQAGFIDTGKKKAYFSMEQLDTFGFGGYRAQCYLPLVLNATTGK